MFAIEFRTKVKDGAIQIPLRHRKKLQEHVKVIIMTDEAPAESDYIETLFENPIKLKDFRPLARNEIYETR